MALIERNDRIFHLFNVYLRICLLTLYTFVLTIIFKFMMLVTQLLDMRQVDIARYVDNELPRIEDDVDNEVTDVLGDSEAELHTIVLSLEDNMVDYVPPLVTAGLSVVSFFVDLNAAFVDAVRLLPI